MRVADLVVIYPTYQKPSVVEQTLPSVLIAADRGLFIPVIVHACVDDVPTGPDRVEMISSVVYNCKKQYPSVDVFTMVSDNMSMADSRNMCLKLAIDRYAPKNILMLEEDHQFKDDWVLIDLVHLLETRYGKQTRNGLRVGMVSGCTHCTNAELVPEAFIVPDLESRNRFFYSPKGSPSQIGGSNSCFRAAPTSHWLSVLKGYDHDEYLISHYQTRGLKFRNYHSGFTTLYFDGCRTVANEGRAEGDPSPIKLWDETYCASDPRSTFRGKK